jgi:metallo-beta-lactamase class B
LAAAKAAAGFDFAGTLARLCIAPQTAPGADVPPSAPPDRATWFTDPAKVFDNLYFVGTKIHSSWALTSREGIILIDTLYDYASEEAIVGGLKKLGLDPAAVKYVIISHAHGDHVGGAKLMQERFGARIVMGGPDWQAQARHYGGRRSADHARRCIRDAGAHARPYARNRIDAL